MRKQGQDVRREEEMRISKMMAEGGQGVQAYYFNDRNEALDALGEEKWRAKAMVDEGGLGAELYYKEDKRISKIDLDKEDEYMN